MLQEQLERVRERIRLACERSGRQPSAVTLVGVAKTVPVEMIRDAAAFGLADIGENRVQEAEAKQQALGIRSAEFGIRSSESIPHSKLQTPNSIRWHLIGHLQRNKVKPALELFDLIHSVDSMELIEALERGASARAKPVDVLLQVNVSGEQTKSGCRPEEALELARGIGRMSHVRLRGLMTIPPAAETPEAARPYFSRLRQLRDQLCSSFQLPASSLKLSMGMSHDFDVAIEEGADIVRIGTAIFGERKS